MLSAAFNMEQSHQSLVSRQPHPVDTLLDDEHDDGDFTQSAVQSPAKSCKVTASNGFISKFLPSTVLWFAVLLFGLMPSRFDKPVQSHFVPARMENGGTAVTTSSSYLHANFNYESVLAELALHSASNSSALHLPHSYSLCTAILEKPQAAYLHPELALLMDLCPLLQAEFDTYADNCFGYAHLCDASRYALPCPVQAKRINSSSLARFTLACNKQQACRSWWLQHQSQHGVCGCAPLMTNLAYSNHHASQAEQKQGLDCLALPSWTAFVWLLIPLGRL